MRTKENAALGDAAQKRDETRIADSNFYVSAREDSADPRACQTAAARRILTPMIRTAARKRWTRVLDVLLDLAAKWTQSV
jgi:hypothetical protein